MYYAAQLDNFFYKITNICKNVFDINNIGNIQVIFIDSQWQIIQPGIINCVKIDDL